MASHGWAVEQATILSHLMGHVVSAELSWAKALCLWNCNATYFRQPGYLVEIADWINWHLTRNWRRSEPSIPLEIAGSEAVTWGAALLAAKADGCMKTV